MGIPNGSALMRAHVTLMGIGLEALETVHIKGHELSVEPIALPEMVNGKRAKAQAITINLLHRGSPTKDEAAKDELAAAITKIIARRHESERNAVIQDRTSIRMKAEPKKAEPKKYTPKSSAPKNLPEAVNVSAASTIEKTTDSPEGLAEKA